MFTFSARQHPSRLSSQRRSSVAAHAAVKNTYTPVLRKLGSSDLEVPNICLGTMTWGQQNTEAEAHEQLNYAMECGINFIDTAEIYAVPTKPETAGLTERYIGSWLKNIKRDRVILATKVAGPSDRITWLRDSKQGTKLDKKNIFEAVDKSLKRLGTDYIDLYQIHWPARYVPLFGAGAYDAKNHVPTDTIESQLEAMGELVKAGKVRHIGLSNETSFGVTQFTSLAKQMGLPRPISLQNSYSLLWRGAYETDLAETCAPHNCNVGLLAYSPLAGGALSGKYLMGLAPANSRFTLFTDYMSRYNKSLAKDATKEYVEVAKKHGLSSSDMALAFVNSRWFTASTIIGATSMDQLRRNINAFSIALTPECLADINEIYKRRKDPAIN